MRPSGGASPPPQTPPSNWGLRPQTPEPQLLMSCDGVFRFSPKMDFPTFYAFVLVNCINCLEHRRTKYELLPADRTVGPKPGTKGGPSRRAPPFVHGFCATVLPAGKVSCILQKMLLRLVCSRGLLFTFLFCSLFLFRKTPRETTQH